MRHLSTLIILFLSMNIFAQEEIGKQGIRITNPVDTWYETVECIQQHDLTGFWTGSKFFADYHSKKGEVIQALQFELGYSMNLGQELFGKASRIKVDIVPLQLNIIDGRMSIGGSAAFRVYFRKNR